MMNNTIYQTVIVGGGFAGLFTALHLSHQHYPRSVILIEKEDRFCFKPLLYEYFSGEMGAEEVWPRYEELLKGSGVIFVKDAVQSIDLQQREVKVTSGDAYNYSNLVLALGSVTGYFGVEGAQENAFPLRTGEDAIAIDKHLRDCLQQALQIQSAQKRRKLLTVTVIGAGASGVEMAGTLGDLLPNWYAAMGGNAEEVRVVLLNHGEQILENDINSHLREIATNALQKRTVPVEFIMEAKATAIRPNEVEYQRHGQAKTLSTGTVIWTTGTNINSLIKGLAISDESRDKHGRPFVNPTLQLLDFPEVFAGGDCAAVQGNSLPPTAQVAYQQGAAIAHNLNALALGNELKPAEVNLRGTLLKLGIEESVANIYNSFEVTGELGHLIRQGSYLELLPTPVHNLKVTGEWLKDEIFDRHLHPIHTADVVKWVGGAVVGVVVARKLMQMLGDSKDNTDT
ncbi:NAD(P)/FAD-dependent oxidoreductase [Microcoleus sp. herbarium8]|uniref:NAD(P)/FAD-dependent oxidoreductase n=2 Tax=unclassified Microcoleus TaxID=2642155 RepID=UPI002FD00358